MKVKFKVPASLSDIPLRDYIEYQKIVDKNEGSDTAEFVTMKMVSIFCHVPLDELQKLSLDQYDEIVFHLQEVFAQKPTFKNRIEVGGLNFGFIPKLDDISIGEYIDLETYMKSPTTYHKAMAVLYRPIRMKVRSTYTVEDYQGSDLFCEQMLDVDLETALGAMLFFWNLGRELLTSMTHSLKVESMIQEMQEPTSQSNGDGINQSIISQLTASLDLMKLQDFPYINVSLN